ncbi:hypothetical protein QBC36DRAFT_380899 [Triangularia setosa]|uniref:Uncharacterized protein n=1 Tax=Triangularia setosa TaxID=2587417 RepID=A0AAN6W3E7_9PEZI|nr:hypothetical protein QBC36DRAFT_380899 [Podospora setosa]
MEVSRIGTGDEVVDQHDEQDDGCECHFNKAEIEGGAWSEDKSQCISNCRTQFLRSITPGWSETLGWADVCGNLNLTSHDVDVAEYRFWSLYWCDSTFCGVAIDQSKGLGQDPNVDSIINTCDNHGFRPIIDPGPPPEEYRCSTEGDGAGSCADNSFTRLQRTSSAEWATSTALTAVRTMTIASAGMGLGSVSTIPGTTSILQESDFTRPPLANTFMAPVSQQTVIPSIPPLMVSLTATDVLTAAAETTSSSTTTTTTTTTTATPTPTLSLAVVAMGTSFSTFSSFSTTSPTPSAPSTTPSTLLSTTLTSPTSSSSAPAAAETSTSAEAASSTTSASGLSGPAKIAIAVCTTIALLILICAALLCLRKRRRGNSPHHNLCSRLGLSRKPWGGNPTPLISPASSLMGTTANNQGITPPLRLRERNFIPSLLPSILRPGGSLNRSGSPPLTPLTPQHSAGVFPSSPICTPTTSKLVPRHERTPGGYTGGLPPIPVPPPSLLFTSDSRGSAASSVTATNNHFGSFHNDFSLPTKPGGTQPSSPFGSGTPPGSPTRPPRPHDGPLEIPDLITAAMNAPPPTASTNSLVSPPLSPPPNRALPAPPPASVGSRGAHPYSFISNSSSNYSSSPAGSTNGRNSAALPGRGTGTATLYHHGRSSVITGGGKRSVSIDQSRDERGSWGSWSGTTAAQQQQHNNNSIGKAIGSVRDKDGGVSSPFVGNGGGGSEKEGKEASLRSSGSSATVTGGTPRTLRAGGRAADRSEVGSLDEGKPI